MSWIVYILKCGDDTLYTGITNDLPRRLIAHETGKGAKYTKGRGPFELLHQEHHENRSAASKREQMIKNLSKDKKLKIANGFCHSEPLSS